MIVGSGSLKIDNASGDEGGWLTVPDSNDVFNFYPQGMTVNAWVKSSAADYQGTVSKRVTGDDGYNLYGFYNTTAAAFNVRGSAGVNAGLPLINDDAWHMVTGIVTDNGDGTITSDIFVDGIIRGSSTAVFDEPLSPGALLIGVANNAGDFPMTGYLDDVKVYSYPLTLEGVADEYQATVPGTLCIYPDFVGVEYDFDGNCIVDLADFAKIAQNWLATGLYTSP